MLVFVVMVGVGSVIVVQVGAWVEVDIVVGVGVCGHVWCRLCDCGPGWSLG